MDKASIRYLTHVHVIFHHENPYILKENSTPNACKPRNRLVLAQSSLHVYRKKKFPGRETKNLLPRQTYQNHLGITQDRPHGTCDVKV